MAHDYDTRYEEALPELYMSEYEMDTRVNNPMSTETHEQFILRRHPNISPASRRMTDEQWIAHIDGLVRDGFLDAPEHYDMQRDLTDDEAAENIRYDEEHAWEEEALREQQRVAAEQEAAAKAALLADPTYAPADFALYCSVMASLSDRGTYAGYQKWVEQYKAQHAPASVTPAAMALFWVTEAQNLRVVQEERWATGETPWSESTGRGR